MDSLTKSGLALIVAAMVRRLDAAAAQRAALAGYARVMEGS